MFLRLNSALIYAFILPYLRDCASRSATVEGVMQPDYMFTFHHSLLPAICRLHAVQAIFYLYSTASTVSILYYAFVPSLSYPRAFYGILL